MVDLSWGWRPLRCRVSEFALFKLHAVRRVIGIGIIINIIK
jgi:hypothetical protein